jgi:hypothetical protein
MTVKRIIIIGITTFLAALIGLGSIWSIPIDSLAPSANERSAPVIDDISCDRMEHFKMHIHAHLDIFINGSAFTIPSDVGRIPDHCIYWVHTHDQKGIIHIESPEERNFTLGEFFDIWGKNFSNNQIFDNTVEESDNNILSVYVNGKKISAGTDYGQITINAHDEIAIIYGKPPASIPSNYEFPEGMRSTVNGSTI